MPYRHEGEEKVWIESWEGYAEQAIREAQARGDLDNLSSTGKPLQLEEENPFSGGMDFAYHIAKQNGAAPLWVQLDQEIGRDTAALAAMLDRTATYLSQQAASIQRHTASPGPSSQAEDPSEAAGWISSNGPSGPSNPGGPGGPRGPTRTAPTATRAWWTFWRRRAPARQQPATSNGSLRYRTMAQVEAERQRARQRYLAQAAELDQKIKEFNLQRPPQLTWLEKLRLLPERAVAQFDEKCPPFV